MTLVETLIDHHDRHNVQLCNEKLQQAVSIFMAETEEKERDDEHNSNIATMDNLCQSPS